jgi:hypothetical protein
MANLPETSIDFARAHIEQFYDSDFFPKPLEFEAIWARWTDLKAYLSKSPIDQIPITPAVTMAAPKGWRGFRIVHQLDPLAALVYTAQVHEVAEAIEKARMGTDTACSYRIAPDGSSFFSKGTGYDNFVTRSEELSKTHAHVLLADISDYYNSIYLHRLNNAVVGADATFKSQANNLEITLSKLNNKVSQGIPVGPAASIVLSECVLADIDQFIDLSGLKFVRYVDDFRIFADRAAVLSKFLEQFVIYLYDTHRLQLAWSKTQILPSERFRTTRLITPATVERAELLSVVSDLDTYGAAFVSESEIDGKLLEQEPPLPPPPATDASLAVRLRYRIAQEKRRVHAEIRREAFDRLLAKAVEGDSVDLGLARRVLRTCKAGKSADAVFAVLTNIPRLAPVMPDVCLYLDTVTTPELTSTLSPAIEALLLQVGDWPRFMHEWFTWYLSGHEGLMLSRAISRYVSIFSPIRWAAKAAITLRNTAWVRTYKNKLHSLGYLDRRAVLVSSRILAQDERIPWLKTHKTSTSDKIEIYVCDWAMTLP